MRILLSTVVLLPMFLVGIVAASIILARRFNSRRNNALYRIDLREKRQQHRNEEL